MNTTKRTVNALLGKRFRYSQTENADLKYIINWGPAIQANIIASSAWTIESGDVTLSSEANTTTQASVIITGNVGESVITNKVTLTDGQVDERIIKLKIVDNDIPTIYDDYGFGGSC